MKIFTHKFIHIHFINDYKDKDGDKHITPVLTYCSNYHNSGYYFYSLALEWWSWGVSLSFVSINFNSQSKASAIRYKKSYGLLRVFNYKLF